MMKKLLMLAVTSGLAAKALQMWIGREGARRDAAAPAPSKAGGPTCLPRPEGEGGGAEPASQPPARMKPLRRSSQLAAEGTPARKPRARRTSTTKAVSA